MIVIGRVILLTTVAAMLWCIARGPQRFICRMCPSQRTSRSVTSGDADTLMMARESVRIVRRPIGEAPDWVRDAWIGSDLPLALSRERRWLAFGVLTMPKTRLRQGWALLTGRGVKLSGYLVNASAAVEILEDVRPDAAAWWREHTPEMLDGKGRFVFDTDACARVSPTARAD